MNKISRFLLLCCLGLISLTACLTPGRGSQTVSGVANKVIGFELWTDHDSYEAGEPVNVRVKLTNVSNTTVTLRGKSGTESIVDIFIQRGPRFDPIEKLVWSRENPDSVLYTLTLAPGESYQVEWTQVLSTSDSYGIFVDWLDDTGYLRTSATNILYDLHLPMP